MLKYTIAAHEQSKSASIEAIRIDIKCGERVVGENKYCFYRSETYRCSQYVSIPWTQSIRGPQQALVPEIQTLLWSQYLINIRIVQGVSTDDMKP